MEKIQFEGQTYYPPKQSSAPQFNSTSIVTLTSRLTEGKNVMEKNIEYGYPKPDVLLNKIYCQVESPSNINSLVTRGIMGRKMLASYPPAKCDQYKRVPDLIHSSISTEGGYNLNRSFSFDKEGNCTFKENLEKIIKKNDIKTIDDLWFSGNNAINVDNRKILRRKSLARKLIPISSSTRPLGLPSSCSPSHYERRLSRFRYRNLKNITSLSRPLLIG